MKTLEQKQQEVVEKILEYFKENEDVFDEVIQDVNAYSGYLGDDEVYEMEMLNELYHDTEPLELLYRVYYGHDDETWTTDSQGNKTYGEFNPNRTYFYFNGYGNLVSCDSKDYSDHLDKYFVDELISDYYSLNTVNYPIELDELIEEYLNLEDDEEESEEEENENV